MESAEVTLHQEVEYFVDHYKNMEIWKKKEKFKRILNKV